MAHLSYYHLLSVYDGYDLDDPNGYFYKRRAELTKIFLERRDFMDMGEVFQSNKEYLIEVGNPTHLNDEFLEAFEEYLPGDDKARDLARLYLLAQQDMEPDSVIAQRRQALIDHTDEGFAFAADLYLKDFPEMLKRMRQTGNMKIRDAELKMFMDRKERKDDKGIIDMLNPFNEDSPLNPNNKPLSHYSESGISF